MRRSSPRPDRVPRRVLRQPLPALPRASPRRGGWPWRGRVRPRRRGRRFSSYVSSSPSGARPPSTAPSSSSEIFADHDRHFAEGLELVIAGIEVRYGRA
ncbi:TetR/AcrR family transcriptional regulator C-terminal domain-containing protein [Streptomyces sp. NPDC001315]|uniref:TetR/AcrR family transcriptional regulator C-terminal domain-containing protein n=1 Tax=Streptomyces sp. NPDC001315 TaxID=3364562 RepID=UPI0036B877DE